MDIFARLVSLFRPGHRSSEFFLTLLALLFPILDKIVSHFLGIAQASGAPVLVIVAAALAAVYTCARALVKFGAASALGAAGEIIQRAAELRGELTPSGNIVTAGPGSPEAEAARRARASGVLPMPPAPIAR